MKKVIPSTRTIKGAKKEGDWDGTDIPIFYVHTSHEFNQVVGYVKFINGSNGTVLYRGQNKLYNNLKPSGARQEGKAVSDGLIRNIIGNDFALMEYLKLDNKEIYGWERYREITIESVLQHYGAKTYCMDFVDNHWCALWFGLYELNSDGKYVKRSDSTNFLYIFLYLADTNGSSIRGLYIGEDVYTVDLRKAIPSYFLRPASQHGWIVRKRERDLNCDYKDNVLCVIKIKVEDADKWLGSGDLLSQNNFLPDYKIDDGYRVLLSRQKRSGVYESKHDQILPIKTIQNFQHYNEYYTSDVTKDLLPIKMVRYLDENKEEHLIESIDTLYTLLLEKGWTRETCEQDDLWNEKNPCVAQSQVTALLVQKIFGGEIFRYKRANRWHCFNKINDVYYDLTSQENGKNPFDKYSACKDKDIPKNKLEGTEERNKILQKNIGLLEVI